ncbi:hypothetical protein EMIHUDRAFT_113071 [Emiliania huxleyi CCMP1516]|uniref:Uncharacterized protein n=2 Tax=Emiliania huxleyi TaxID=2903 RepID=A0A0D3K4X4_EMIH1|nr:hypothetical protein EMIHUDRAFT_113071 [Emiliania huxleyi CCMP1516]EOD30809.1 hypothetical protein EMIHUDRAFT_113071 [Emiliania huxleyi CCMP1516]|eukprot:XP_005783238.1 hypothetical protein EMIHUDRAFT_113071 [Emiliania huxleyi CCMP1516]
MPDLTAAELSIPAEQHPDPAKPLVIPVDSTVVGSTLRFIPWSVVGNPALLQLPPPPPGMQPSWVQIPQWVAISALLPFSEPEPAVATHFDRLSVLRLAVLAAAWRRILGALSDLGVFSTVHVDEDAFRTVCIQALHSRQIPVPELYLQWGDLGYSEAIVPLGPAPSAEAKAVDFLQYATVGALCDPTADVPFAALSDMTRCLGPVFTAAARVDPMGSAVVGAASLAAAAGHITPRASDGHPALLSRHVLSMLKTTRSSFPACLRTNSFQNYSAEVETRAEYVGGTAVARDRVAEQRCSRAIAAKAPTLDSLLRALPRPTPPSVVYEAYRQLVSLYFPTDRRPMDLLLTDLDAQLHARLPTYQHALTNGKPFASILAGLRKLHESLEPSRKAPVMTSTGDSEDSALGKFDPHESAVETALLRVYGGSVFGSRQGARCSSVSLYLPYCVYQKTASTHTAVKQRRRRESGSLSALLQPSQPWVSAAFAAVSAPLPECGLDADGAAPPALLPPPPPPGQPALTDAVVLRVWSTEGQCEGMTRQSGGTERCRVHRNSPYAVAAPLRRGERYCGHHHPDKFTGVQCAGQRKHGKGRCRVWSGCCYADAAPLRRGSPYCHHHRVRCVGLTQSGARCTVTSSSENVHAQPLRDGELHCAHHQPAAPSSLAPSAPCPRAAVSDRAIVLGSGEDFEGPDGPLPPSIAIVESEARLEQGNCLTQLLRRFPALHYTSIKYSDPTLPHLWVLPLEGQTAQTGRLADFMVSLGLTVREQDLDYESSDDDAASDVDSARCDEPLDPDVEAELPDYF